MLRFKTVLILFIMVCPVFAKGRSDFSTVQKIWGRLDSLSFTKSGDKFTADVKKGPAGYKRDVYMIKPEKPELLLWLFHGYKPENDPYKQSPEIFIKNLGLKELASWHNILVVIIDSGTSLYSYTPDNGISEIEIYSGIYSKLISQYGPLPAILAGVSSGAEGAVKFAPFVNNLKAVIGISGTYDFDSLAPASGEYKIHLKEYGSPAEWKYEQPVGIIPSIKCRIILLSEENSIYRSQAEKAALIRSAGKIEFFKDVGKGKSHDWGFWGSEEVKKILVKEIQSTGLYSE